MELRAYLSYKRIKKTLSFWRTSNGDEVDFIIGDQTAIEIKSTSKINDRHFKGLLKIKEENIIKNYYLISLDEVEYITKDRIRVLFWKNFLTMLWNDEIIP